MLETSARLLRLLSLLQARPAWTAGELAERLGVTDRTVRRDMVRLRELGYPVDAVVGPEGGYRLGRGGALPPLLLDDDEAVAVAVGLRAAAAGGVSGVEDATVSALAKLEQVLPARLAARVRAVHEVTAELLGRAPDPVDAGVLAELAQACRNGERARLGYARHDGEVSERRVDPYRLVRSGPRWYLVAHDVDRRDWRTFRLDRVRAARSLRQPGDLAALAASEGLPDPVAMVSRGLATGPWTVVARLRMPVPPEEARAVLPRTVATHTPDGAGGTIVEFGSNDLAGMARQVAALGVAAEVLSPPELREAVAAHARALAELNAAPAGAR
ncbi:MAG TPA: YafY family protein [Acidimicrobiales bacterium]|nr:YafY family protein [Acidimicrobiales bacterium]